MNTLTLAIIGISVLIIGILVFRAIRNRKNNYEFRDEFEAADFEETSGGFFLLT